MASTTEPFDPVPRNGAAKTRTGSSPSGTGLASAAFSAGEVPALASIPRPPAPSGVEGPDAAFGSGGRNPRRARTSSPGRLTLTSIFRKRRDDHLDLSL